MEYEPGSFRDPSGSVFYRGEKVFRRINLCYKAEYDHMMNCGLYDELTRKQLLVPHEEVSGPVPGQDKDNLYKIIKPEKINFISYPYEWCFSQLKDAALVTLRINNIALKHGMILKDASAFNIQFVRGKPVHIDTLSFDFYREGSPWIAYRQFCTHFLAPLAIMRRNHLELGKTFRVFLDGIPLQMAAKMLRLRDKLNPGLLFHILLHARMEKKFGGITEVKRRKTFSSKAMRGLCDSLTSSVEGMKIPRLNTEWGAYYCDTNYTEDGLLEKERIVREFSNLNRVGSIWDLGANNGFYTRVAMKRGYGVAFDMDHSAVEDNYAETKKNGENITPLWMDLTNPSPCLGWASKERKSLTERGGAEMCLALALIHHLCISNNVPLEEVASFLAGICRHLIIEFVPINDSQVKRLLVTRKMIFHDYTESNFVGSFKKHFFIEKADSVKDSLRKIYFMTRK